MFHVLQSDSTQLKPPSTERRQKHSVDNCTPHDKVELKLLHKKFEYFYKEFSSPVHNNSKKRASTLPTAVGQCYELTIESHKKPDFQSLYLHTFYPNKRNCSCGISLSRDSIQDDPDYQEIPEEDRLILPSTRTSHFF